MPGKRGRPPKNPPTVLQTIPGPPPTPKGYVSLLADDDAEIERAAGAHNRLVKWCSPARPNLWVGIILIEEAEMCEQLARIKEDDFAVVTAVYMDQAEAESAMDAHMTETVNDPS